MVDGARVEAGEMAASWDPHTHPIVSEMAGTLKFVGLDEGLTISLKTDDLTGLSSIQVLTVGERPAAGKDLRPMLKLV